MSCSGEEWVWDSPRWPLACVFMSLSPRCSPWWLQGGWFLCARETQNHRTLCEQTSQSLLRAMQGGEWLALAFTVLSIPHTWQGAWLWARLWPRSVKRRGGRVLETGRAGRRDPLDTSVPGAWGPRGSHHSLSWPSGLLGPVHPSGNLLLTAELELGFSFLRWVRSSRSYPHRSKYRRFTLKASNKSRWCSGSKVASAHDLAAAPEAQ